MGQYRVDSSDMPIVRITFDGAVSDDEFRAYLDAYDAIVDEGKPYVAVFDARTAAAPPARQRRMMAKWLNDRGPAVRRVCHGGAFAITSRVIRGSSWRHAGFTELRLSYRDYGSDARPDVGFRIARNLD